MTEVLHHGKLKCPFCSSWFSFGDDSVAHGLPMCDVFETLSPLDFVVKARQLMVGPMPWDPLKE